jgi:thiol-disulfide isomerase/thioredoxin
VRTKNFYLEQGTIMLTGNPTKLADLKITGSKTQVDKDELDKLTASIRAEEQPIIDALYKEKDHGKASAIRDQLDPYKARIKRIKYTFFLTHPTSYIVVDEMRVMVSDMGLDSIKRVYNGLNTELKESPLGKNLAIEINKIELGSPGHVAAIFSRIDINGKMLLLADFKGKYVMLDFWASWCVPCREGSPHMLALYNKYKSKGYDVIGIADDDTKDELWKGAVAMDKVGVWHHVLRGLDMDKVKKYIANLDDLDELYGIHTIPTKILIDPTGKIIGRFGDSYGGSDEDMDKMLASIFGK